MATNRDFGMVLTVSEIERKTNELLKNKYNANTIIELIQHLFQEDSEIAVIACISLEKVFTAYIANGDLDQDSNTIKENLEGCSLEEKFIFWLKEQYSEMKNALLTLLSSKNHKLKEVAIHVLWKLLIAECAHPLTINKDKNNFPSEFLNDILAVLTSDTYSMGHVIQTFEEYIHESNVVYFLLKCVHNNLKNKDKKAASSKYLENIFSLLQTIKLKSKSNKVKKRKKKNEAEEPPNIDSPKNEEFTAGIYKKFSLAWLEFLKFKLPISLYKKILVVLHENVMPFMTNPLLLTDFLTESYNIGGVVSLLALNGLFYLIRLYNLEYPEFYTKLYALLTDVIFCAKYRARFFYLTDIFLSSTHLPAYLVAAFAKRLARLALRAPVDVILILIPFIGNLFVRHPSLSVLIRRPEPSEVTDDPYLDTEADPSLCNALESSLWEIKTLQNHWHPDIATKAKFINKAIPSMEWDLSDVLETRYKDVFEKELNHTMEGVALSTDLNKGFLDSGISETKLSSIWTLS